MADKRNLCKYDDYIESKAVGSHHTAHTAHTHVSMMPDFKLDKIFPKNISFKLNGDSFDGLSGSAIKG